MSNEPKRIDCLCSNCIADRVRAEAPARAPECEARTATQYLAREQAEIRAARRARLEADAEAERLRTFLKDCRCPCCDARSRLRAISYERACESPAAIHCETTDRRDDNADALRDSDEERANRRAIAEETVFPALDRLEEDTGAGPAGTD